MLSRVCVGAAEPAEGSAAPWGFARAPRLFAVGILALLAILFARPAGATVELTGLSRTTERVVLASLRLDEEPCNISEARLRRLYRRADAEIRNALEVYGYYEPTIEKALDRTGECWVARFNITRGKRVKWRTIQVRVTGAGREDVEIADVLAGQPFETGEGLNQRAYDSFKASLGNLARQRGYFEGQWTTSRLDVYPAELAADVTLDYSTGERYRFGKVEFEQSVLKSGLVAGFVDFKPGDPYDAEQVNSMYTALLVSGWFQGVDVQTTPRPAPYRDVPIKISLSPALPRNWTAGLGYATDTGAKVRLGYLNRRRNTRGHQLELNASLSQVVGEVTASYRLPYGDPRNEWLSFDTGYKYDNPEDNRSDQYRIGVKQIVMRRNDWRETRFIDYSVEDFVVGEDRGTSELLIPGISWSRQTKLLPIRPKVASRFGLQLSGTGQFLGSDTDFFQTEANGKIIRPLWKGGRVLARARVGVTIKDELSDLPLSVRYFAGGDDSVRGYDYKSLGPTDENGVVLGGSHKVDGSIEVDQEFLSRWAGAAFIDVGNAFDSFSNMSLKAGVGVGVRWYSPLGPIRVDLAFPTDDNAPDSFRIHVTLGPEL